MSVEKSFQPPMQPAPMQLVAALHQKLQRSARETMLQEARPRPKPRRPDLTQLAAATTPKPNPKLKAS